MGAGVSVRSQLHHHTFQAVQFDECDDQLESCEYCGKRQTEVYFAGVCAHRWLCFECETRYRGGGLIECRACNVLVDRRTSSGSLCPQCALDHWRSSLRCECCGEQRLTSPSNGSESQRICTMCAMLGSSFGTCARLPTPVRKRSPLGSFHPEQGGSLQSSVTTTASHKEREPCKWTGGRPKQLLPVQTCSRLPQQVLHMNGACSCPADFASHVHSHHCDRERQHLAPEARVPSLAALPTPTALPVAAAMDQTPLQDSGGGDCLQEPKPRLRRRPALMLDDLALSLDDAGVPASLPLSNSGSVTGGVADIKAAAEFPTPIFRSSTRPPSSIADTPKGPSSARSSWECSLSHTGTPKELPLVRSGKAESRAPQPALAESMSTGCLPTRPRQPGHGSKRIGSNKGSTNAPKTPEVFKSPKVKRDSPSICSKSSPCLAARQKREQLNTSALPANIQHLDGRYVRSPSRHL